LNYGTIEQLQNYPIFWDIQILLCFAYCILLIFFCSLYNTL